MNDKLRIMVGVNTLTSVDNLAYSNHMQFWYRLGKNHPDKMFGFNTPHRSGIDAMRNHTAKVALDNDFDYILFIDDDVLLPFNNCDPLQRLLDCNTDIAAGWTVIRGYPYNNMFFKYDDKKNLLFYNEFKTNDKGLIECNAVGFSCCLIKCDLLRKVPPPFFVTGPRSTEDVYFCVKAKTFNPDVTIVVDPIVKTSHILGSEIIDPDNRDAYKTYQETCNPYLLQQAKEIYSRGDEYLNMVEDPTEENINKFYYKDKPLKEELEEMGVK